LLTGQGDGTHQYDHVTAGGRPRKAARAKQQHSAPRQQERAPKQPRRHPHLQQQQQQEEEEAQHLDIDLDLEGSADAAQEDSWVPSSAPSSGGRHKQRLLPAATTAAGSTGGLMSPTCSTPATAPKAARTPGAAGGSADTPSLVTPHPYGTRRRGSGATAAGAEAAGEPSGAAAAAAGAAAAADGMGAHNSTSLAATPLTAGGAKTAGLGNPHALGTSSSSGGGSYSARKGAAAAATPPAATPAVPTPSVPSWQQAPSTALRRHSRHLGDATGDPMSPAVACRIESVLTAAMSPAAPGTTSFKDAQPTSAAAGAEVSEAGGATGGGCGGLLPAKLRRKSGAGYASAARGLQEGAGGGVVVGAPAGESMPRRLASRSTQQTMNSRRQILVHCKLLLSSPAAGLTQYCALC
jgi:hypothetical protein